MPAPVDNELHVEIIEQTLEICFPDQITVIANTLVELQVLEANIQARYDAALGKTAHSLSGLTHTLTAENLQKSPEELDVMVRKPDGSVVSVMHRIDGTNLVFESNLPMDGLIAYL